MIDNLRILSHDQVDKKLWDHFVGKSVNRRIYATSFFLDIFNPGWKALLINGGAAVMPLTWNRKFGVSYLYQPVFVQQLGLFFQNSCHAGELPALIGKLSLTFRYIDISLNEMNSAGIPSDKGYRMSNYLLSLDRGYDLIAAGYKKNTRRNILKAGRLGVNIAPGCSPAEILDLFRKNNGKAYRKIKRTDYRKLLSLLESGIERGVVEMRCARSGNGKLIAAACFLKDFDRYVFYFSANSEMGRRYSAMFFLIDNFIRAHAGCGMILDFNGSVSKDVARFYKGFGATEVSYQRVRINNLGAPWRWVKRE